MTTNTMKSIIKNIIGVNKKLPNGDFYHLRFSLPLYLTGKYPWKTGMGTSKTDAIAQANGRPCKGDAPPVRVNTAEYCRRADGIYPQ